jgi:adenine-specific DNA-methyltransferase
MQALVQEQITADSLELEYSKFTSIEHRKKFAQFFTPMPIANLMAKWILGNDDLKTVLEPAFGLGVFSRAIFSNKKNVNIKGYEVDFKIYEKAKTAFLSNQNVSIILEDYLVNDWENKYDGIICNPPYFKFHDYDNKTLIKEIESKLNCKLTGFTNLYTLFLLKSIFQLNKNGRAAYIVPSEFLNSDYGKLVKSYLIKSKTLRHIVVIDFEENVFDDALTTASIVFCANDNQSEKVQFSNVHSINDLEKIEQLISDYPSFGKSSKAVNFSELNPEIKWRAYYQEQNSTKFKHLVPFTNFAKVVRGIATGANEYFVFNQSKANEFSIPQNYLLPCICKSVDIKKSFFTNKDFQVLNENNRDVVLLNAVGELNTDIEKYLQKGVDEGIDKKFLTSSRSPWYSLEKRPPSPIWVSVFNRNGLKFIRNEANISNLTTFHCIYPNQTNLFSNFDIDLLFAYLLTNVAKQIFDDNRREYGNGLKKFEPNDINKAQMLNLELLDKETERNILELYRLYRKSVIENTPDENHVKQINQIFVECFT